MLNNHLKKRLIPRCQHTLKLINNTKNPCQENQARALENLVREDYQILLSHSATNHREDECCCSKKESGSGWFGHNAEIVDSASRLRTCGYMVSNYLEGQIIATLLREGPCVVGVCFRS